MSVKPKTKMKNKIHSECYCDKDEDSIGGSTQKEHDTDPRFTKQICSNNTRMFTLKTMSCLQTPCSEDKINN